VNDKTNEVKLIVDKKVFEAKTIIFPPMQNNAHTEISIEDLKKFLKTIGKVETVVDFEQLKKDIENEAKEESKSEAGKKKEGKVKKEKKGKEAALEEE